MSEQHEEIKCVAELGDRDLIIATTQKPETIRALEDDASEMLTEIPLPTFKPKRHSARDQLILPCLEGEKVLTGGMATVLGTLVANIGQAMTASQIVEARGKTNWTTANNRKGGPVTKEMPLKDIASPKVYVQQQLRHMINPAYDESSQGSNHLALFYPYTTICLRAIRTFTEKERYKWLVTPSPHPPQAATPSRFHTVKTPVIYRFPFKVPGSSERSKYPF